MAMLSFDEARTQLLAAARPVTESDILPLTALNGRVLAASQTSALNVPPHDNSAMDGYVLRVADVPSAGMTLPLSQRIAAGDAAQPLQAGSAARIFTGAVIPPGADAVVMQENCSATEAGVQINYLPSVGEHIRRAGEDIAAGAAILQAGERLGPSAMGLLASVGVATVPVFRRLRVALFSTGNELQEPGTTLRPGAIYNSNRYQLIGLLTQLGCDVTDLGIVPDSLDATRQALRDNAATHDLLLTSGGVSVGEEDHVKAAVQAEGALDLWKIAIKPGKPLAYGKVGEAAFIGLPGNPVAAFVTFLMLVVPFIRKCQGEVFALPQPLQMRAGFDWKKADTRRNFLRARPSASAAGVLELFPNQGSGVLTSTHWSAGLVDIEIGQTVVEGDSVNYYSYAQLLG